MRRAILKLLSPQYGPDKHGIPDSPSLDGLGLLSYESIVSRDFPVVLGALYLFTLVGLIIKLLGDIAYVLADPRIKYDAQEA